MERSYRDGKQPQPLKPINKSAGAQREDKNETKQGDSAKQAVRVVCRGFLLKKNRTQGHESKPWKKRYFVLQGATLYYYKGKSMAGAHKLFAQLDRSWRVTQTEGMALSTTPTPYVIRLICGQTVLQLAADSSGDCLQWITKLAAARDLPQIQLADQTHRLAKSSAILRLRMSVSAALASSSLGRKLVSRYMDEDSRSVISVLVDYAKDLAGKEKAKTYEKGIFDLAARMAVVHHAGRLPPDLDLSLLYDETVNFSQDFLMYSREKRLARKGRAETIPVDMAELLRSSSVMVEFTRELLKPHTPQKVMNVFEEISQFYFCEEKIHVILHDDKHADRLAVLDGSLRAVLEKHF
eukprot:m.105493 g.105493  ORF g.105493 m.105493 type:complete len:352 (-) comp13878_c0_seq4:708-1763(-)